MTKQKVLIGSIEYEVNLMVATEIAWLRDENAKLRRELDAPEPKAPLIPVQGARPMDLHQWGDGCATHAGSECVRVYDADAIDALILELSAGRPAEPKATLAKTASGGTLRCGQHGLPNEIRGDRIGCRKCFEVNRGAGQ